MKALHFEWPNDPDQHGPQDQKGQRGRTLLSTPQDDDDTPQISTKEKINVTLLAQQMAKDRDSFISDADQRSAGGRAASTPDHKKEQH
ncbi:MAG: hypothetical protein E4H07_10075 [Nitrosomonadales bacterium]|nr:MAG: hypothetical protein E4H07_10075 [Nitrosomonadales bacterium]